MPLLPDTISKLNKVHKLIRPYIIRTPVIESPALNDQCGSQLFFKCENFQRVGAFKARGALHAILRLNKAQLINGVATHSSGNHAQALAYAAKITNTKAIIVMPENATQAKIDGVKNLGGEIIFCEATLNAREKRLLEVIKQTGAYFVPPYNHEWIIAGQGTAAKELIEDNPGLDFIIAPVGGGGLLSGTALAAKLINNQISVYGAEPENLNDAQRSFKSGKIEINNPENTTMADGLRTTLGEITLNCILRYVKDILTVKESEILESMILMRKHLKITAEPSGAVALAAVVKSKSLFQGKKVGIIVSGGNIDPTQFPLLKG